ncbi:MAG: hypothetical protein GTN67_05795 [Hydrotalea flava]|uniref:hypothetical protein n=1 Tax=Hydrotalea TaxID=1004300 RepID=UPI001026BFF9|nr:MULTISPECIES: hypothetical protein [Hydrotalea]NIM34948.1 hypothetical protein [Hydrotalea flava]NIM37774.1 hypothetical protein [Hydrotalea flava]NIN02943.1 hypothetical protein [Hydrotalea flava]NIN14628.1 hypothetical protein [Hydrotalea flava]NIO93700.1 hypothetical protein [Hydrotalea flava]
MSKLNILITSLGSRRKIMSVEKFVDVKIMCLRIAAEACKHCPDKILDTAKNYYDWIQNFPKEVNPKILNQ